MHRKKMVYFSTFLWLLVSVLPVKGYSHEKNIHASKLLIPQTGLPINSFYVARQWAHTMRKHPLTRFENESKFKAIVNDLKISQPSKPKLLTIEQPQANQKLYSKQIEIFVRLHEHADPKTFKVWLNLKDITGKFSPVDNAMRAWAGPEDGLKIYPENQKATRQAEQAGLTGGSKNSGSRKSAGYKKNHGSRYQIGRNFLKAFIKDKKGKSDTGIVIFSVKAPPYGIVTATLLSRCLLHKNSWKRALSCPLNIFATEPDLGD
ncbi:MAG: hypothetical protein GY874_23690 [Desulfobacteraceae bacterium]|nr:hypothetical protein [Desulfobacteraceae bacterium]